MMSIKYNGLRWQQIMYLSIGAYATGALIASGLATQYNDIEFTGTYLDQYHRLTADVTPHTSTNVALLVFMSILGVSDLFRVNPFPVWFEMSWSLVFGILEVGNIVLAARDYPQAHCTLTPAINVTDSTLSRRDSAGTSIIGVEDNNLSNRQQIITDAAKGVCGNWSAMFTLYTMAAILMLFLICGWWALVGLRHRRSHPTFFLGPVPQPLKWELSPESATERSVDIETASVTSTAVSFENEKKMVEDLPVAPPAAVMVRLERLEV
ncbi:hypothetical protein FRB95_005998 [Tulasnella sp. JGI-2019a]|nr:hypothetical protein FRB95_005998 [Tulasnella sp. JGI-2019a]